MALTDDEIKAIRERCEATDLLNEDEIEIVRRTASNNCAVGSTRVERLLATLDHERAARHAAEADAVRCREALAHVESMAWGRDGVISGFRRRVADAARDALRATDHPGITLWQAVVEAARRVVAEAAPDAEGLRREPSRQAVDALAEALREAGVVAS